MYSILQCFPKVGKKNISGMTVAGPTSQDKALGLVGGRLAKIMTNQRAIFRDVGPAAVILHNLKN
jgi:hypothetical protein